MVSMIRTMDANRRAARCSMRVSLPPGPALVIDAGPYPGPHIALSITGVQDSKAHRGGKQ
jgi:hypothetical protein